MSSESCGRKPRSLLHLGERTAVVGLLLALTACASDRAAQYQPPFGDTPPSYVAEARPPRVQTEADGLPAQPPPLRRTTEIDDPREPWSRNYGTVAPSSRTAEAQPAPSIDPEPARVAMVTPKRAPLFGTQPIDAEAIIRRAIAEHEMRRED